MPSKLLVLCGLALASSSRHRSSREEHAHKVRAHNPECDSLSGIVTNGRDFTGALTAVCKFWPTEKLGEFPLTDISRARELLTVATGPGGAWDQIKEIHAKRNSSGFCWRNYTLRTISTGTCQVSARGVCYGSCPEGYRPSRLSGIFRAACITGCSATSHPFSCGFACASNRRNCHKAVAKQIGTVVSGVGTAMGVVTGDDRLSKTIGSVVELTEFLKGPLPIIVDAIRGAVDIVVNNEHGAIVAVILYEYLAEMAPTLREPAEAIKEAIPKLGDIIANLGQEIGEKRELSLDSIRGIFEHGEDFMEFAARATKAFSYKKCAVNDEVAFTVETIGDERLMGPWIQDGEVLGRPRYVLKGDRSARLQFTDKPEPRWVIIKARIGPIGRRYLYESKGSAMDYPTSGWSVLQGVHPVPLFVPFQKRS